MIDAFLEWWLKSGRYGWSKLRRRVFEQKYLKTKLPDAHSLGDVGNCLKQITWIQDNAFFLFDCVSYPERTWATKKDDCDGFASVAAALINSWNPALKPVMVTAIVRPLSNAHTVCAFHHEGSIRFFNNENLDGDKFNSYEEVIKKFLATGDKLVCWDVREPKTFARIEFHRV